MISTVHAAWRRHSTLGTLLMLSGFAGLTIGMLQVLSTLFAIRLGASGFQMGLISGAQSFCMAFMTLPAGLAAARFGPRAIYLTASLFVMAVYLVAPFSTSWVGVLIAGALGNLGIPFRIVAITGTFMERLKTFGASKAGWYRGSQVVGMIVAGPLLGTLILQRLGVFAGYWTVAAMFSVMAFAGLGILPAHPKAGARPTLRENVAGMAGLLRDPAVLGVCTVELSSSAVVACFTAFVVLIGVTMLHLPETLAVSVRFVEGGVAVCTLFLGSHALRALAAVTLYRVSLVLVVVGLVLVGLAQGYWSLSVATLLLGTGVGVTNIVNVRQLSALEHNKSRTASLQLMSSMSGSCLGGVVGGALSTVTGLRGLFFLSAAVYGVLALRWCFGGTAAQTPTAEAGPA
ncbi:MAG: hypothetical protein PW843_27235 [Azospirillaceae bacterium]|nr:hypothetical protein [Azospirillaceae bacterium]